MAEYVELYKQAFDQYRVHALWNIRQFSNPTPADALIVARYLRQEGDRPARFLAERIEALCRPVDAETGADLHAAL